MEGSGPYSQNDLLAHVDGVRSQFDRAIQRRGEFSDNRFGFATRYDKRADEGIVKWKNYLLFRITLEMIQGPLEPLRSQEPTQLISKICCKFYVVRFWHWVDGVARHPFCEASRKIAI